MTAVSQYMVRAGGDAPILWAERSGRRRASEPARGRLRFAFYGRVSTEDYQDPVSSRLRQRDQAGALVAGHGRNPRYTGWQVWNRQPTDFDLIDPANTALGHRQVQRWNLPVPSRLHQRHPP